MGKFGSICVSRSFFINVAFAQIMNPSAHYAPESHENIISGVEFLLFSNSDVYKAKILKLGEINYLYNSTFDPALKTKIVVHGFQSACYNDVFLLIKNAYLQTENCNVICFDWSTMSKRTYPEAVALVQKAGLLLSRFIDWLIYESGLDPEDIHLIGHSLGAHVVGIAGSESKLGTIGRITGLDPAVPMITFDPEIMLDSTDANFVEALFTSFLSHGHPLVHVNYVLNGGIEQPGCKSKIFDSGSEMIFGGSVLCSHSRSYEVFADSIVYPRLYYAKRCDNLLQAMDMKCSCEGGFFLNSEDVEDGVYSVVVFLKVD